MSTSLLWMLMSVCWTLTLVGGLGVHVLEHYNGRKLEAYCRLKRNPSRFGEILDREEDAAFASQYLLLFGLVVGSLAAGSWLFTKGQVQEQNGILSSSMTNPQILAWVTSWLVLLTLAGLWLPRIVVRYSSSFFLFHSWPFWKGLALFASPFTGLGDVFSWVGQRLSDEPESEDAEEEILQDEILTIVQAGNRDGVFSDNVQAMIEGVMELDEVDVQQIMTPRSLVDAVNYALPWEEIVKSAVNTGRTRLPVYKESIDNVIGILFVKDLLKILADTKQITGTVLLDSILRRPWFVPSTLRVDQLLRIFLHNRNHMAIVVDDFQQFVGVVTIEDALEEIVGEIADELDVEEDSQIVYNELTHQIEAEGKVPIEALGKLLGIELPESDDYDTIGGLVVQQLSEIPTAGTIVDVNGVRITVLESTKRMVKRVRLELVTNESTTTSTVEE